MLYAATNTVNNQMHQSIQCVMINILTLLLLLLSLSLSLLSMINVDISQYKGVYSDQVTVYHKVCCMQ
jgi:hypothetical protein